MHIMAVDLLSCSMRFTQNVQVIRQLSAVSTRGYKP